MPQLLCWLTQGERNSSNQLEQLYENWKRGTKMKSKKFLESSLELLPPTKQTTLLASSRLTRSEIDSLRQGKKLISDYAQKELSKRISIALKRKQDKYA